MSAERPGPVRITVEAADMVRLRGIMTGMVLILGAQAPLLGMMVADVMVQTKGISAQEDIEESVSQTRQTGMRTRGTGPMLQVNES